MLLTLKNFHAEEYFGKDSWLSKVFVGKDSDFSQHWYCTVGLAITMTMIINSMAPLVQFGVNYVILTIFRFIDRGLSCRGERTKQNSLKSYIDLYAGPEFALSYRFSAIILQICITALFGASIPILFAIAFGSLFFAVIFEKITLCYFFKEPPMYDESITRSSNTIIKYVIYLGLFTSSWQLGNR